MVVAVYEGEWFVAEVFIPRGYKRLSYTSIKGKNVFSWPDKKDIVVTLQKDILMENIVQKYL